MMKEVENPDKWETIKILRTEKEEMQAYINETGRFSNVTDLTRYAIKTTLERLKGGKRN